LTNIKRTARKYHGIPGTLFNIFNAVVTEHCEVMKSGSRMDFSTAIQLVEPNV